MPDPRGDNRRCCFREAGVKCRCDDATGARSSSPKERAEDADSAVAVALAQVGSRLRRIRDQRGLTLIQVSDRTGISKRTLSRLETGQRGLSLELLLPLAQVYRVPIDDLVGAPDVGDPRVRLKPRHTAADPTRWCPSMEDRRPVVAVDAQPA